jgi:hypothetical protein
MKMSSFFLILAYAWEFLPSLVWSSAFFIQRIHRYFN